MTDQRRPAPANEEVATCVICGGLVNHDPQRPRETDFPRAHRACDQRQREEYAKQVCVCGHDRNDHDGLKSRGKCIQCGWKFCPRFKLDKKASARRANAAPTNA